jgi:feruloyl esterase
MQFMQLHPDYFDGVVAGSPVLDLGAISADTVWALQQFGGLAPKDASGTPQWSLSFSAADQALYTNAYLKQCDALDGVADGMVQNPSACHFDPASLQCPGAKDASCWSAAQVAAVKAVVGGPVDSTGGRVRVPGYSLLRENPIEGYPLDAGWMLSSGQAGRNVGTATTPPGNLAQGAAAIPYLYLTTPNPSFNPLTINWDSYPDLLLINAPWLSNSPDLAAYKARGGKVIFTHGTADPGPTYANTVNFFNRMTQLNGGTAGTQGFARLFLVPSMGHCSGGASTDSYDPLQAIVDWVEKGTAPDTLPAKARSGNTLLAAVTPSIPATRTRPLCPYPKTATYKGSGSIDDAASFTCQ